MRTRSSTMAFLLMLALPACRGLDADAPRIPANAQLDSGNIRLAAGDPSSALRHYQAATTDDEAAAAAWFGVYLATRAVGDTTAAADALQHVQQVVPDPELFPGLKDLDVAAPHPIAARDAATRPRP